MTLLDQITQWKIGLAEVLCQHAICTTQPNVGIGVKVASFSAERCMVCTALQFHWKLRLESTDDMHMTDTCTEGRRYVEKEIDLRQP